MEPVVRHEQLRDIGLFGGLSDEALDQLARELKVVRHEAGVQVMREGENAREMFVVLAGELEVMRHSRTGVEGRIAVLGPGNWFGEMSLIDPQPRSASVQTIAPTVLLRMASDDLDRLYRRDLKAYTLVVLNIARELARRLRVADGMITNFMATIWDENMGFHRKR